MKGIRLSVAAIVASAAALVATYTGALAYTSGSIGFDISYPDCGSYPATVRHVNASGTTAASAVSSINLRNSLSPATSGPQVTSASGPWWTRPRNLTPTSGTLRTWYSQFTWGIVGVDGGRPFNSQNLCLASEYRHTTSPGLYVNTGFDPSYETKYTTVDCQNQSKPTGTAAQQAAWAVGCSEAEDDFAYASSQGIMSAQAWWLDVETANSWCSPAGPTCTDLSLNQYTVQGLIDEFTHIGAVPVGIYSNNGIWTTIMGTPNFHPTGASMEWYASGMSNTQQAKLFCNNTTYSFSGSAVAIVQFVPNPTTDRDYAC